MNKSQLVTLFACHFGTSSGGTNGSGATSGTYEYGSQMDDMTNAYMNEAYGGGWSGGGGGGGGSQYYDNGDPSADPNNPNYKYYNPDGFQGGGFKPTWEGNPRGRAKALSASQGSYVQAPGGRGGEGGVGSFNQNQSAPQPYWDTNTNSWANTPAGQQPGWQPGQALTGHYDAEGRNIDPNTPVGSSGSIGSGHIQSVWDGQKWVTISKPMSAQYAGHEGQTWNPDTQTWSGGSTKSAGQSASATGGTSNVARPGTRTTGARGATTTHPGAQAKGTQLNPDGTPIGSYEGPAVSGTSQSSTIGGVPDRSRGGGGGYLDPSGSNYLGYNTGNDPGNARPSPILPYPDPNSRNTGAPEVGRPDVRTVGYYDPSGNFIPGRRAPTTGDIQHPIRPPGGGGGPGGQFGTGGSSGNRALAVSSAGNSLLAQLNNPNIDDATKAAISQEGMNTARSGFQGARGQIARNAAATNNQGGVTAALASLGRGEAGAYGMQQRQNLIDFEKERQRRLEGAQSGLANLGAQEGTYTLGALAGGSNLASKLRGNANVSQSSSDSNAHHAGL